ncbi:uncharacterized protein LOC100644753 isoform X2 [Bombus terrestris]|nr:uncharacterized protein LOC100644753 isoform X2 [Bombus terrestris]
MVFSTSVNVTGFLDEKKRNWSTGYRWHSSKGWLNDISRYESSNGKLLAINGERNRYMSSREYRCEMKTHIERRGFLLDSGSSIFSQFPLAPIYHSWKFSKEFCPSAEYHSSSMQKLSNSMLKFHSFTENPSYQKSACKNLWRSRGLSEAIFCSMSFRNYSSSKDPPCDKTLKSDDCDGTTIKDVSKDCYSKFDEDAEECPKSSRKCQLPVEDDCEEHSPFPCPDVKDYCPTVAYEEKLLQLVTAIGAIVLIGISCYVYTKVEESDKQPRPVFIDVPYMRRITKPFPWGDGEHTLFHNPGRNPISPHGYEVEDRNAVTPSQTAGLRER